MNKRTGKGKVRYKELKLRISGNIANLIELLDIDARNLATSFINQEIANRLLTDLQRPEIIRFGNELILSWGGYGTEPGHFNNPYRICTDHNSYVYVTDPCNNRVQKFTDTGVFVQEIGVGELTEPRGIRASPEGDYIYVTDVDYGRNQILKYTTDGSLESTLTGQRANGFLYPSGIGVDAEGNIYVCDWSNKRIQRYSPEFQFMYSYSCIIEQEIWRPWDVVVDNSGIVIAAVWQPGTGRFLRYNREGMCLGLSYPLAHDRVGEHVYYVPPNSLALGLDGHSFYEVSAMVANCHQPRRWSSDGVLLDFFIDRRPNARWSAFMSGVAVDDSGDIYVTEGHYVYKYSP